MLVSAARRERRNTIRPDPRPNLAAAASGRVAQRVPAAAQQSESDSSSSISNVSDPNRKRTKTKTKKGEATKKRIDERPRSAPPAAAAAAAARSGWTGHGHLGPAAAASTRRTGTNITNSNYLAALNAASGK